VLGLPFLWFGVQRSFDQGMLSAAGDLVMVAAEAAVAVLLLLRPSREWYGIGRGPGEPSPWRWSDSH
jgi:hypothetical protein